jgi:hypothetical protein
MTVPTLKHEAFLKLLKENGWEVASDEFWNDYNRIILKKGDITFPLQYKASYAFTSIVRICMSLDITPPDDHLLCYEQYEQYKKRQQKEKGE